MSEQSLAIVTGASRGIGAGVLKRLAQNDTFVVGTATSEAGAEAISKNLSDVGLKGQGLQLDFSDSESVKSFVAQVNTDFGVPTVLVNNAGIARDQLLLRMSESDWDDLLATNLKSVYQMSKAFLRGMMKARYGRIINIGSVIGLTGNAGQANYAAAKAGMIGFSKSLAQEVGSRGITVNVVAPGFIDTDMTRELPDAQKELLLGNVPLKRLGQVEDIAEAVAFLASDAAGYITGETLHVNGGMYMA